MSIPDKDIKKLWGKSAGRCCFDGCGVNCIATIEDSSITFGEMAHIIAKRPSGPRGDEERKEDNSYDNLILLCPNHHAIVDKNPEIYTEECLRAMKKKAEENISHSFDAAPIFSSLEEACDKIAKLLIENKAIWAGCGPKSACAQSDPNSSSMAAYWGIRKLCTIVPNNRKIVGIIRANESLFDIDFYSLASEFIEHAIDFEQNCYDRIDCARRFPLTFEEKVFHYARKWKK